MFHTNRDLIVFSERARSLMEKWAPGQVESIPVSLHASAKIAARLKLAGAHYFINILGRAQRLQWLEMQTQRFPMRDDGTVPYGLLPNQSWKLRERAAGITPTNATCSRANRYAASDGLFASAPDGAQDAP